MANEKSWIEIKKKGDLVNTSYSNYYIHISQVEGPAEDADNSAQRFISLFQIQIKSQIIPIYISSFYRVLCPILMAANNKIQKLKTK